VKLCPPGIDKQWLYYQQYHPHHQKDPVNMDGRGFVYEIWELAGICPVESPLYPDHNKNDEDGGVAINFLHGL